MPGEILDTDLKYLKTGDRDALNPEESNSPETALGENPILVLFVVVLVVGLLLFIAFWLWTKKKHLLRRVWEASEKYTLNGSTYTSDPEAQRNQQPVPSLDEVRSGQTAYQPMNTGKEHEFYAGSKNNQKLK